MTDLARAIARYHALLDAGLVEESQGQLDEQQRRRGLFFGERPLCVVLRPRFLTAEQYGFLRRSLRVLMRAFGTAFRAALADPALRAQFMLADWEEELVQVDRVPENIRMFGVPATRLAEELGRKVVLNIVMVGFFAAVTNLLNPESVRKAVEDSVPPAMAKLNLQAFDKGFEYGTALVHRGEAEMAEALEAV